MLLFNSIVAHMLINQCTVYSKHQFQKYSKLGFRVEFRVVNAHPFTQGQTQGRKGSRQPPPTEMPPDLVGTTYFDAQFKECCSGKAGDAGAPATVSVSALAPLLPLHFLIYTRLAELYLTVRQTLLQLFHAAGKALSMVTRNNCSVCATVGRRVQRLNPTAPASGSTGGH
jgi:hypothetical protein